VGSLASLQFSDPEGPSPTAGEVTSQDKAPNLVAGSHERFFGPFFHETWAGLQPEVWHLSCQKALELPEGIVIVGTLHKAMLL